MPNPTSIKEIVSDLCNVHKWTQVVGWSVLAFTTFIPVMAFWGAGRLKPSEPLLPICIFVSVIGGTLAFPLCYAKKGYWLPGVITGPLFGPGVFLAFWLLAGTVMNKLIFLVLVTLGGAPSFALFVLLLHLRARQLVSPPQEYSMSTCGDLSPATTELQENRIA
jgi:hypothetical protein